MSVYWEKKYELFMRIERTKDKKCRSALLAKFNNMIGAEQHQKLYEETQTSSH